MCANVDQVMIWASADDVLGLPQRPILIADVLIVQDVLVRWVWRPDNRRSVVAPNRIGLVVTQ